MPDITRDEALLACAIWRSDNLQLDNSRLWKNCVRDARDLIETAPPDIRRALGGEEKERAYTEPPLCSECCKERVMRIDGSVLMYGLKVSDFAKIRAHAWLYDCKPSELIDRLEQRIEAYRLRAESAEARVKELEAKLADTEAYGCRERDNGIKQFDLRIKAEQRVKELEARAKSDGETIAALRTRVKELESGYETERIARMAFEAQNFALHERLSAVIAAAKGEA